MAFDYHAWLSRFPGTNFHELNIDWLIDQVKALGAELKEFEAINTIKLEGVWDISKNYGTWSVVTDDNGDGYISIKPVPAGVDISNTDYWMKLYDFVTALGALTARVAALEGTVSTMSGTVTNLSGRITTAEGNITSLGNRVTTEENKSKALIKGDFYGKALFIGDSWGAAWNAPEGTSSTSFEDIIARDLKISQYWRYDEGGAGWAYPNGHWYGKLIENFCNDHPTEKNNITNIFIIGGQNDLSDPDVDYVYSNTTYECKWTANYIAANLPNAKVWCGMVARTSGCNGFATYNNINTAINKYKSACREYGWNYIPGSEFMVHEYGMIAPNDGAHLTHAAYITLGHYLAESIKNGFWEHPPRGYNAISLYDTDNTPGPLIRAGATNANIEQYIASNGVTLQLREMVFLTNPISSIDCATTYTLCKYGSVATNPTDALPNFFNALFKIRINVNFLITYNNGTTSTYVPGVLIFNEDGVMRCRLEATTQNGQGWAQFNNVTHIILCPFSATIPLELC